MEEKCSQMIPALDPCIGPMSIASQVHSPFHLDTNCVMSLALKLYSSSYTFRFHKVISHSPSHPIPCILSYSVMYFYGDVLSFFFLFDLKFYKTCLPPGPAFRSWVFNQSHSCGSVAFTLKKKTVLIAGNELSWVEIRVNCCFTQWCFYELPLWYLLSGWIRKKGYVIRHKQGFMNQAHYCHEQPTVPCRCRIFFVYTAASILNL